jgi:hypothetical protein
MSDVQTPPDEDFLRAFKELQRKVDDISNNSVSGSQLLTGDLVGGFGATRVGCLLCDGSTIADSDYPALGAYIRANLPVAYVVDGTHVKLPDYRGAVLGGADGATFVKGTETGVETVTLTSAQSGIVAHTHPAPTITVGNEASHTHSIPTLTGDFSVTGAAGGAVAIPNNQNTGTSYPATRTSTTGAGSSHTHTGSSSTIAANTAANAVSSHTNVQPTLPANIFIKI